MYCTKCGSEIPDDAKFCTFCGETTDYSTRRQIQPIQPAPTPSPSPSVSKPKSSSGIIAVLCIVFMVGILLLYFGATTLVYIPSTAITLLVIGSIVILCIGCSVCGGCGSKKHRGGYGGGGDCSGCDCSGCDCDCGGCDC